jgi:hypothetical protein
MLEDESLYSGWSKQYHMAKNPLRNENLYAFGAAE